MRQLWRRARRVIVRRGGAAVAAESPVRPVASAYCVGSGWSSWPHHRRTALSICVVERGTRAPQPRRQSEGFTLLEVLVAMAILSLAVVTVIQGFASGLRLLKLSGEHQEAMLIADLKLREMTAPTQAGRDAGTEGRYTWEREVKQVVTPDLEIEGRTVKWHQWEVDVHVRWGDHREVSVSTLRTVAGDGDRNLNNPTGLPRS